MCLLCEFWEFEASRLTVGGANSSVGCHVLHVRHDLFALVCTLSYLFISMHQLSHLSQAAAAHQLSFYMSKETDGWKHRLIVVCSIVISCFVRLCAALQFALHLVQTVQYSLVWSEPAVMLLRDNLEV